MFKRKILLFLIILLSFSPLLAEKRIPRNDIISAYIYQLNSKINWPHQTSADNFNIHFVGKSNKLSKTFKQIISDKKINSRNIIITYSSNEIIPSGKQVIFIEKSKLSLYPKIFDSIEGKSVLIISDSYDNKRQVMINLFQNSKKQLLFEINKANIINQNLSIDPDIILLGGTEIDVAKLYKTSQETLRSQEKRLESIERLNARLSKQTKQTKKEIFKLEGTINSQNKNIDKQLKKLNKMIKEVKEQKTKIASDKKLLIKYTKDIKLQKKEINIQKVNITKQKKKIDEQKAKFIKLKKYTQKQEIDISKRAEELDIQSAEMQKRADILEKQLTRIEALDRTIKEQESLIKTQMGTMLKQKDKIETQLHTLYLLGLVALLVMLFAIYFYYTKRRYKLLSAELKVAKESADYANHSKSIFLANMSHELRTPLNAIMGFSEILSNDKTTTFEQQKSLGIINQSGIHLLTLINDVLSLSKIEAGRLPVEKAPFDVGNLVNDVLDLMKQRANAKGLKIELDQSSSFPRYINSDVQKIRQILINYLSNSVKYTNEGGLSLMLDAKDGIMHFEVRDTGVGISNKELIHVFEPFIQVGSASAKTGTGLGLSITKEFAKLLGGSVGAVSDLGKGSNFWAKIPYEEVKELDVENLTKVETTQEVIGLDITQHNIKILIVEDQPNNSLLLEKILEPLKVQVKLAINGQEAVEIFETWRPDFIWMDRRMPVMGGEQATENIRKMEGGKDVIIVALTASAFHEEREAIMASGMDDYLAKPYRTNEIYDMLKKHLNLNFIYKNTEQKQPQKDILFTKDELIASLSELDSELVNELYNAVLLLDSNTIDPVILKVQNYSEKLADIIKKMCDNFQHELLLSALESIKDN